MTYRDAIQKLLSEYRKSTIQSEAEVRSKFIVPLLDILGYPSELRAEEFPVYGYGGGKKLPAKNADFILFCSPDFGHYRTRTQRNLGWVHDNSLLVVEAKKPGEMPKENDLGQAQFYTAWTKSVAYIETDGEKLIGRLYKYASKDYEVINLTIDELSNCDKLELFAFESVQNIKKACKENDSNRSETCVNRCSGSKYEIEGDIKSLPDETIQYMQSALGRNAEGLNRMQLVSKYLNITDAYLVNDIRYDIPPYMLDVPRHKYKATLYINDIILPMMVGTVLEFYWNEIDIYRFENQYIQVLIVLNQKQLALFDIGFRVLDQHVSERLLGFSQVNKCLSAETIRINVENEKRTSIVLPTGNPGALWPTKEQAIHLYEFWLKGMNKLKAIEVYYEIEFQLRYTEGRDNLNSLYDAIDIVYDGMCMNQNCEITVPGDIYDGELIIEEPVLFQENVRIPLQDRVIQGIVFRPYRSAWLPCRIDFTGKTNKDTLRIPGCCEYRIVEEAIDDKRENC